MPNRMMPELTAPMMKNFTAASVACLSRFRNATRAKVLRLDVSNARNRTKRSAAATDLFVLFLAFETSSLSTFALVAFRKRDKQATEAAVKFFIIGAVSSGID